MEDEGGLGILPTKEELVKKAEEKASPAPAAPKKKKSKKSLSDFKEPEPMLGTQILVLKTQVGQERRVAEALGNKARRFGLPVVSLLAPAELRGFVFIETTDPIRLEKGVRGVSYARALIKNAEGQPEPTPFGQIAHFLTPVSAVAKIAEGDIVELVSGPFRGEKAKVTRVDDTKEEITVELIESMVPIPITVKGEHVRVLQKSGEGA
jgi:transcription termination/antitermination protein NusG